VPTKDSILKNEEEKKSDSFKFVEETVVNPDGLNFLRFIKGSKAKKLDISPSGKLQLFFASAFSLVDLSKYLFKIKFSL
jgi:hypothetical protein